MNSIKFYWNGYKIDDGELQKITYLVRDDEKTVTVYAEWLTHLLRELFEVINESNPYTDYHEDDRATVGEDHPLYSFIRSAAYKCIAHQSKAHAARLRKDGERRKKDFTEEIEKAEALAKSAEAETIKDQPSADDLAAALAYIEAIREAERRAKEAERDEYIAEYGAYVEKIVSVVETALDRFPILDGAPVVRFEWSECGAIKDGTECSAAAAELIITAAEALRVMLKQRHGYDKTSFVISWKDGEGESTYEGRYDIGCDSGTLEKHFADVAKSAKEYAAENRGEYAEEENRLAGAADTVRGIFRAALEAQAIYPIMFKPESLIHIA